MNSIREQICLAYKARLDTITEANGYNYDLPAYRARKHFDEEDLPASTMWPGNEQTDNHYNNVAERMMTMDFEAHIMNDTKDSDDILANKLLADIRKCLGMYDETIDDLIISKTEQTAEIAYPNSGSESISILVSYLIKYTVNKSDPYTQ